MCYNVQSANETYDPLAQMAEHLTFNQGVRGSIPRWVTSERDRRRSVSFDVIKKFTSKKKQTDFGPSVILWLGRRDSNPRMTESKSVALPLGYSPKNKNGVGYQIRTDDLQCHKLAP